MIIPLFLFGLSLLLAHELGRRRGDKQPTAVALGITVFVLMWYVRGDDIVAAYVNFDVDMFWRGFYAAFGINRT